MQQTAVSPFESLKRFEKAIALADVLDALGADTAQAAQLRAMAKARTAIQQLADVKKPSAETWTLALQLLTARREVRARFEQNVKIGRRLTAVPALAECGGCGESFPDEPDCFPVHHDLCATCTIRAQREAAGLCGSCGSEPCACGALSEAAPF